MAIFNFGKDKLPQEASGQTLAYLEDALRLRSPFLLTTHGSPEVGAVLHSLSEDARTLRLLPERSMALGKGSKVAFTLIHEGLRMGGTARAVESRDGMVVLQFQDELALMERRRLPRARFHAKEGATLTALQSLFEGVGMNCTVENISEGGARVRVDRAITVTTEKRLALGPHLVPPGQSFMVLKLNKLPKCPPVLETAGKLAYLVNDRGGLMMGLTFDKPGPTVEAALRGLVAGRAKLIPLTLPPKNRRPKPPTLEELEAEAALAPPAPPEPMVEPTPARPEPLVEPTPAPAARALDAAPADGFAASLPLQDEDEDEDLEPLLTEAERVHLRLSLGPGFRAAFQAGEAGPDVGDLLDVSIGGCCLRVAPDGVHALGADVPLENFHFLHRDLPNGILPARVTWVLGKNAMKRPGPTEGRYCLVGVRFLELPTEIEEGLEAYIAWNLPMD